MDLLQDLPRYMLILIAASIGLGLFLCILWIIVPFFIIGIKPLLKDMRNKLELIEGHLNKIAANDSGETRKVITESVESEEKEPPPTPM